jgi:hypothetical protein
MTLAQTQARVFAFDLDTAEPVTGDAANITANWSKDYAALVPLTDTNPTESQDGYYYFTISDDERDVTIIGEIFPESSTSGVQVIGVPAYFMAAPITVVPITGIVDSRVDGTTITVFTSELVTVAVACVDSDGDAVDISAMNLEIIIENQRNSDIVVIANASITKVVSTFSFTVPISVSGTEGNYQWALRKTTDDSVLMQGPFVVVYAPQSD